MNIQPENELDTVVTIAELCNELKISRASRIRWDRNGMLPPSIKIGTKTVYSRKKLDTWKADQGFVVDENPKCESKSAFSDGVRN